MLADEVDYVGGVDTHRDEHVLGGGGCAGRRCGCPTGGTGERGVVIGRRFTSLTATRPAHEPGRSKAPVTTASVLPASSLTGAKRRSRSAARRDPSDAYAARTAGPETATAEAAELERELLAHVRALAPALLDEPGVGPVVAAQLIVAWSHGGDCARRPPSRDSPASPRSPPPVAKRCGTGSAAAATGNSTAPPCTRASSTAASTTR